MNCWATATAAPMIDRASTLVQWSRSVIPAILDRQRLCKAALQRLIDDPAHRIDRADGLDQGTFQVAELLDKADAI